jgi:putative pyruvate formate lyase activating enzyme
MEDFGMNIRNAYEKCELCPRRCGVSRITHDPESGSGTPGTDAFGKVSGSRKAGFCGCTDTVLAVRAALHMWEEPCISGLRGSGTVFFSGCTLRCCFCQNYRISTGGFGKELTVTELADVFLRLQDQGAHNISLVTATQYLPSILPALDRVKDRLHIPVVYNCGGYERVETVRALRDYVDIWLPDLKYFDSTLSRELSGASDYFERASEAILAMIEQTGEMKFHTFTESCEIMDRGVIVRHMVLPGHRDDSIRLLHWIADTLPHDRFLISLMSQYTPYHHDDKHPELNRRITSFEYNKVVDEAIALGLTDGFMQEKSSAKEEYTPPFDLEGL